MKERLESFKKLVIQATQNPNFRHHKWYVKYHLSIVEKLALELCDHYPKANSNLVFLLVWLHDYGKILDFENRDEATLVEGRKVMEDLGFPQDFIDKAIRYADLVDNGLDANPENLPIEVKIISSADAASHFIGPFFSIWWYENANKPIEDLMQDNRRKAHKNWNKKILLPEVREAFRDRYLMFLEQSGELPLSFFGRDAKS